MIKWGDFLLAATNLWKLKVCQSWLKLKVGWACSKNGHDLLGPGVLKSVVSQEGMDELSWFLFCQFKFRKSKGYFDNVSLCVFKMDVVF